ncbi:RidA family protein [Nocardia brevicatena]|uniref:RidA family protein n=1 Tax=Nocardia brevicatena TaxID=37327 RepID=UPI0002E23A84|nr:RidA family protein [Nocardia brevicatena]
MHTREINRTDDNYSQAIEVVGASRLLFISEKVGEDGAGNVPESFREQALLAWSNIADQLTAAGMDVGNIVRMTIYPSDRRYRREAYETR